MRALILALMLTAACVSQAAHAETEDLRGFGKFGALLGIEAGLGTMGGGCVADCDTVAGFERRKSAELGAFVIGGIHLGFGMAGFYFEHSTQLQMGGSPNTTELHQAKAFLDGSMIGVGAALSYRDWLAHVGLGLRGSVDQYPPNLIASDRRVSTDLRDDSSTTYSHGRSLRLGLGHKISQIIYAHAGFHVKSYSKKVISVANQKVPILENYFDGSNMVTTAYTVGISIYY